MCVRSQNGVARCVLFHFKLNVNLSTWQFDAIFQENFHWMYLCQWFSLCLANLKWTVKISEQIFIPLHSDFDSTFSTFNIQQSISLSEAQRCDQMNRNSVAKIKLVTVNVFFGLSRRIFAKSTWQHLLRSRNNNKKIQPRKNNTKGQRHLMFLID